MAETCNIPCLSDTLPQCQLFFLRHLVQTLIPFRAFMCSPTAGHSVHTSKARGEKTGLQLIRKVFAETDKVLVVDSELLQVERVSSTE